ncbi:MAG: hypothetical protein RIR26_2988 [Pseudomonadota bacterium]
MLHLVDFFFSTITSLLRLYSIFLIVGVVLRLARADESSMIGRMVFPLIDPPANYLKRKFPKLVMYHSGSYVDFSLLVLSLSIEILISFIAHLRPMIGI